MLWHTREGTRFARVPSQVRYLLAQRCIRLTLTCLAYDETMKVLVIAATVVAIFPIFFSLMMPNYHLGDKQNAVDDADLTGERASRREPEVSERQQ